MSQGGKTYERYDEGRIGLRILAEGTPGKTMFVFPHAGAQSLAFRGLAGALPSDWRVIGLDPPGHGWSAGPPLHEVASMTRHYVQHIPRQHFEGAILFGHSLGGLVAYSVAQELWRLNRPVAGLVLSATRPPHRREDYVSFSTLDDRTLLDVLIQIGGVPASWKDEPEVFDYFKESVRADFAAFDALRDLEPLPPVPTLALGGMADQICRPEHVFEWSRYCSDCQVDFVDGGHLFIQDNPAAAVRRMLPIIEPWCERRV